VNESKKKNFQIALIGILVVVVLLAVMCYFLFISPGPTAIIKDIAIIILALESIVVLLLLGVVIGMLWWLIQTLEKKNADPRHHQRDGQQRERNGQHRAGNGHFCERHRGLADNQGGQLCIWGEKGHTDVDQMAKHAQWLERATKIFEIGGIDNG